MPNANFADELEAQLKIHKRVIRIVDPENDEWEITDVTYDGELDELVIEIDILK